MIRDEIHDGFGHPGLGRSFTLAAFKAFVHGTTRDSESFGLPDGRQSLAVELGRQRDLFGPKASKSDATPRLRRMSETVSRLMANSFAN